MRRSLVVLGLLAVGAQSIAAGGRRCAASAAEGSDRSSSAVEFHGFLMGAVGARTTGKTTERGGTGEFVIGEERLRVEIGGGSRQGEARFLVKADALHDALTRESDLDVREAYVAATGGPLGLQLGREVVTWGVGDLFFISDVFPKDWESFFAGRPMEYLKLGVDGLRVHATSGRTDAQVLIIPFFAPDALPSPERFVLATGIPAGVELREGTVRQRVRDAELAARVSRRVAGFDVSLHGYRGYWRTPAVRLEDSLSAPVATRFYPRLSVFSVAAQRGVPAGVLSLEAGYYDSRSDRSGGDAAVANSQWRLLAGFQRQMWSDLTMGVQAYGERLQEYDAYRASLGPGPKPADELRLVGSARLTQFLAYNTWRLSLFAAYSPTDEDGFAQAEISHKLTDELSVAAVANLFSSRSRETFFGQLDGNDNVSLVGRYDF